MSIFYILLHFTLLAATTTSAAFPFSKMKKATLPIVGQNQNTSPYSVINVHFPNNNSNCNFFHNHETTRTTTTTNFSSLLSLRGGANQQDNIEAQNNDSNNDAANENNEVEGQEYVPLVTPTNSDNDNPTSPTVASRLKSIMKKVPVPAVNRQNAIYGTLSFALLFLIWKNRVAIGAVFDKDKIQAKTLYILNRLDAKPKYQSFSIYLMGMFVWEALGLSTIPIETAAGMVFGWYAILPSFGGKILGAYAAFASVRYGVAAKFVQNKLADNSIMNLLQQSTTDNPLQTVFLIKNSCVPETFKNYGTALIPSIKSWMFLLATTIHGLTFTALWTFLGVDAARRLKIEALPANRLLNVLLILAGVNAVVISPLAMGWWIKKMHASASNRQQTGQQTKDMESV